MIVTDIVPLTKNRNKVYIDNEFAFVLYKGELHVYHVTVGKELPEADYNEIMQVLLPKRAKLRAMNLLQKKTYCEKQLETKLKEGFYSEEIVEEAIAYVKSFHYVDDLQYAIDYITYHESGKPLAKLREDLLRKGISKDTFDAAVEAWQELGGNCDESAMIYHYLEKKGYSEDMDLKEKQRIFAYLLRKGFAMETISKAMKNLT